MTDAIASGNDPSYVYGGRTRLTFHRPDSPEAKTVDLDRDGKTIPKARIPDGMVRCKETGCLIPDDPHLIAQHWGSVAEDRLKVLQSGPDMSGASQLLEARRAAELASGAAREAMKIAEGLADELARLKAQIAGGTATAKNPVLAGDNG